MAEVLLNTMFACQTGKRESLLQCMRDVAVYAFSYDNINYARYLTPFLSKKLNLKVDHPAIHSSFVQGNVSEQLSDIATPLVG